MGSRPELWIISWVVNGVLYVFLVVYNLGTARDFSATQSSLTLRN